MSPRGAARRGAAIWLVLFALYATTSGTDAFSSSEYGGDEPHYLLAAESIVSDGDVDLTDEYASRAYSDWYPYELDVHGTPTEGRLHEPHGVGFPLLIAPAYALGGPGLVELFLAAIAALGFVAAAAIARRVVPEPYATGGVLAVGASAPALAYGGAVYPELTAGAALAGAALLALRARESQRMRAAVGAGALVALLPWLGPKYLLEGLPVLAAMAYWLVRRGRRTAALVAAELAGGSIVLFVSVNEALYRGPTPYSAGGGELGATAFPSGYLDRLPRLAALWLDREYGMVRWAPVLVLALGGAWALWRSRRDRISRAVPERRDAENAASIALLVCAAAFAVATFASPTMFGFWFPPRHLVAALPCAAVLVAWGIQRAPRTGAALAFVSVATGASLVVGLHTGAVDGWVRPDWPVPYGPLDVVLPLYGVDSAWADVVDGVLVAGLALLALREWRSWRQTVGTTRRAYSG